MDRVRESAGEFAFGIGIWLFAVVALALLPIGLGALSTISRGNTLSFVSLFENGEMLLVSTAILGAAIAELLAKSNGKLPLAKLFAGGAATLVILASSGWFADIAAGHRDGTELDGTFIAVGSVTLFGIALICGLTCFVVVHFMDQVDD